MEKADYGVRKSLRKWAILTGDIYHFILKIRTMPKAINYRNIKKGGPADEMPQMRNVQ